MWCVAYVVSCGVVCGVRGELWCSVWCGVVRYSVWCVV